MPGIRQGAPRKDKGATCRMPGLLLNLNQGIPWTQAFKMFPLAGKNAAEPHRFCRGAWLILEV